MLTHSRLSSLVLAGALTVLAIAVGSSPAQAQLPKPPKVLGCELGPNLSATKTCLDKAIKDLNDEVGAAEKAADAARKAAQTAQQATQAAQQAAAAAQQAGAVAQQQLQKPWVAAMTQVDASQLMSCLASRGINLSQTMSSVAQNPTNYVRVKFTEIWQKAMTNSALIGQQLAAFPPAGREPSIQQIIDNADQLFASLAAQDPATQCLWAVMQPFRAQAKTLAAQIYPVARQQYDALVEQQVKPAVNRAAISTMRNLNSGLLRVSVAAAGASAQASRAGASAAGSMLPEEFREILAIEASRYLLDPGRVARGISELNALGGRLGGGNPSEIAAAMARLERELDALSALDDRTAVQIGLKAMRDFGHREIDRELPKLVDQGIAVTDTLTVAVVNAVTAIVALWYEPAEVIGELVTGMVGIAIMIGKPGTKDTIVRTVHSSYDLVINAAERALRENRPPSSYLQSAGPLGDLLSDFPTERQLLALVSPDVGRMQSVLSSYHRAVAGLGRNAAGAASNTR